MIMAEVKPEPEPEPPWAIDKAVKFWQHSQYSDLSSDFLLSRLEQAKDHSPLFSRFEILGLEQIYCLSAVSGAGTFHFGGLAYNQHLARVNKAGHRTLA